jgi:hypothetical protein
VDASPILVQMHRNALTRCFAHRGKIGHGC